ncbi:glycoside hydrolase family 2 protein [Spirilliplanes yamanashiensis]|uniref:beta-mannosidase n=1 Tax=Spirilliplanes yamanashiensis TaxID=42233 RepID=A0A8J4DI95_9ACTN|nr:glycoside hydrolase family 2 protein [Spirilliplanes yamanashiensis]MDP9819243.1 beta-mannosidase [Spirilliplanes yamanashiensis]GIJ01933.1 beta-mannosidase [Spirilliplanes yamanashiensis]
MTTRRDLHTGWTLSGPSVTDLPAEVPGCVHTDLLADGVIDDPYIGDNETRLGWIGRSAWSYTTTFDLDPEPGRLDLVCDGLDTVATVSVNGVELGRTANMHRSYRFDLRAAARPGANTLRVDFGSAYEYAEAVRDAVGERPNAYPEPFQYIRKMACNFGWDWGPTLVTAGIWRPIGLEVWSTARLASVRPLITVDGSAGRVEVLVDVERDNDSPLVVTAEIAGVRASAPVPDGASAARLVVDVPQVERWWPRGYGAPALYPLDVRLTAADGRELDAWSREVGFRSVRVDTGADADGTAFRLLVNDVPVFVRGANWIPDDCFPHRVTPARYAARLAQAAAANVNLLRVWGGGRYESEDFYAQCDRLGLLVTQDFLFACAAYPEEEPLGAEVAAEAREHVARLTPHPSLVLWIGNNENIWGYHDWGWKESLAGRTWGLGWYLETLPAIVSELDPTRPYWPGSPWSGSLFRHPNDPAHGTTHVWDVWNQLDYTAYRDWRPRFVAEFGYQAPATWATLRRADAFRHQKAADGNRKLQRGLDAHLPEPRDLADWHYLTQVNQARAVSLGVEHFRSLRPLCAGTIMWQLNDCWPVTSWSAVDGDGRRKPLWYALRRSYADHLLTIQPREGGPAVVLVNDGPAAAAATITVRRVTFAGEVLATAARQVTVPAGEAATWALHPELGAPDDPRAELLVADAPGCARAFWFFVPDRDAALPPAAWDATVTPAGDEEMAVTVRARTLLRDLTLFPDRLDPLATADEALVTLLPGESATFMVRGGAHLEPAALTSRPVLRCVNDVPR